MVHREEKAMGDLPSPLDFLLPPELEAHEPPEARGLSRDAVRLLVSFRGDDQIIHARFSDLPLFLRPGDLIVVNDSATLPAALPAKRTDGSEITLHLSTQVLSGLWVGEPRKTRVEPGERLSLPGGGVATVLIPYRNSARLWVMQLVLPEPLLDYLSRWGRPITYPYVHGQWPIEIYQTVYAVYPGSAEMPSAGRAFTWELIERLQAKGIGWARITLHTGVASLEHGEELYEEFYAVPHETALRIRETKLMGGRVIAVGTTVVRALESSVDETGCPIASKGWTDLVITPARGVQVVDGLLTGFHEPKATHLAMLEAIAGRAHLAKVYAAAVEARYLWHEFGDLHLIL
ncbi:MAG: S-adenosylmethionine:tRNA ribosyltransferase-isomerase [Armatimonadota bacterium]|nr:S-adenosylmethionine:tRNA ribosyltransferase-isomerase [Armatimonadota bacterium]